MRSRVVRPAIGLCAALLLAACGQVTGTGDPSSAAVVADEQIPIETVEERFEQAKANPQVSQQLEADPSASEQIQAQVLTGLIQSEILRNAAEERAITVTDEEVAEQRTQVIEQLGGEEAFNQAIEQNGLSPEDVTRLLREQVLADKLSQELAQNAEVTDQEVREFYEQNLETRFGEKVQVSHVLTETRQQAQKALARLKGGENFGAVARDASTDPSAEQNAGDLGQVARGQTVPAFEEAAFSADEGELVGPIKTEFGFHILKVGEQVPAQELPEVEKEIRAELQSQASQQVLPEFLQEQASEVDVEVNPRFGTWDPETGTVTVGEGLGSSEDAGVPVPEGSQPAAPPTE